MQVNKPGGPGSSLLQLFIEAHEERFMSKRCAVLASTAFLGLLLLGGCNASGGAKSACEIFSPATVTVPTTQNDQRVTTAATGLPSEGGAKEQNCN